MPPRFMMLGGNIGCYRVVRGARKVVLGARRELWVLGVIAGC